MALHRRWAIERRLNELSEQNKDLQEDVEKFAENLLARQRATEELGSQEKQTAKDFIRKHGTTGSRWTHGKPGKILTYKSSKDLATVKDIKGGSTPTEEAKTNKKTHLDKKTGVKLPTDLQPKQPGGSAKIHERVKTSISEEKATIHSPNTGLPSTAKDRNTVEQYSNTDEYSTPNKPSANKIDGYSKASELEDDNMRYLVRDIKKEHRSNQSTKRSAKEDGSSGSNHRDLGPTPRDLHPTGTDIGPTSLDLGPSSNSYTALTISAKGKTRESVTSRQSKKVEVLQKMINTLKESWNIDDHSIGVEEDRAIDRDPARKPWLSPGGVGKQQQSTTGTRGRDWSDRSKEEEAGDGELELGGCEPTMLEWLQGLYLRNTAQCARILAANNITMHKLVTMSKADFRQLGIRNETSLNQLMSAIEKLKKNYRRPRQETRVMGPPMKQAGGKRVNNAPWQEPVVANNAPRQEIAVQRPVPSRGISITAALELNTSKTRPSGKTGTADTGGKNGERHNNQTKTTREEGTSPGKNAALRKMSQESCEGITLDVIGLTPQVKGSVTTARKGQKIAEKIETPNTTHEELPAINHAHKSVYIPSVWDETNDLGPLPLYIPIRIPTRNSVATEIKDVKLNNIEAQIKDVFSHMTRPDALDKLTKLQEQLRQIQTEISGEQTTAIATQTAPVPALDFSLLDSTEYPPIRQIETPTEVSAADLDLKKMSKTELLKQVTKQKQAHQQQIKNLKGELDRLKFKDPLKKCEISQQEIVYHQHNLLGKGSFSKVYHGVYQGAEVAIKQLKIPLPSLDKNYFLSEVSLLKDLNHPCIVLLLGYCIDQKLPLLVHEYMSGGSLYNHLHNHTLPSLDHAAYFQIARDIALGMNYLHSHQPSILHLDLKSINILLSPQFHAKIGDFGFSKIRHEADSVSNKNTKVKRDYSAIAGVAWLAPELFDYKDVTVKADVYSYGIILWEMLSRRLPFQGLSLYQVIEKVRGQGRPDVPSQCSAPLAQLITACWHHSPSSRPRFKEVLERLNLLYFPPQWQDLFTTAHIPQDLLEDLDTARTVISVVSSYMDQCTRRSPSVPVPALDLSNSLSARVPAPALGLSNSSSARVPVPATELSDGSSPRVPALDVSNSSSEGLETHCEEVSDSDIDAIRTVERINSPLRKQKQHESVRSQTVTSRGQTMTSRGQGLTSDRASRTEPVAADKINGTAVGELQHGVSGSLGKDHLMCSMDLHSDRRSDELKDLDRGSGDEHGHNDYDDDEFEESLIFRESPGSGRSEDSFADLPSSLLSQTSQTVSILGGTAQYIEAMTQHSSRQELDSQSRHREETDRHCRHREETVGQSRQSRYRDETDHQSRQSNESSSQSRQMDEPDIKSRQKTEIDNQSRHSEEIDMKSRQVGELNKIKTYLSHTKTPSKEKGVDILQNTRTIERPMKLDTAPVFLSLQIPPKQVAMTDLHLQPIEEKPSRPKHGARMETMLNVRASQLVEQRSRLKSVDQPHPCQLKELPDIGHQDMQDLADILRKAVQERRQAVASGSAEYSSVSCSWNDD